MKNDCIEQCNHNCLECPYSDCINDDDLEMEMYEISDSLEEKKGEGFENPKKLYNKIGHIKEKKRKNERIKNGLCVHCGTKLPTGYKYKSCEDCLKKRNDYKKKYRKRKSLMKSNGISKKRIEEAMKLRRLNNEQLAEKLMNFMPEKNRKK